MYSNKWNPAKIYDFLIIGSGIGGSSVAYSLEDSGYSVLMIEQGDFINQEKENWDVAEIVLKRRYAARDEWLDRNDQSFSPRIYYNVGGNTKFFGGSSFRLRNSDFRSRTTEDGYIISWPITYQDLEPWYTQAEQIMGVRGLRGEDPTEPDRGEFPYPPVEHEPVIKKLSDSFVKQGLHPFHLPLAIDLSPEGRCRKGSPCDGFPCLVRAKGDAENRFLRPVLLNANSNLTLLTGAEVRKMIPGADGKSISSVSLQINGKHYNQKVRTIILSAGAVNSAALLLRSANKKYPNGLANSSGMVGRHYMSHRNTVMMAASPFKRNSTVFQKTMAVNDFYEQGWGNIQMRGKIRPENLQNKPSFLLRSAASYLASRTVDLWLMTEDFPDPESRVIITAKGQIKLIVQENNLANHKKLVQRAGKIMRKAGYPIIISDKRGISAVQHQCGTIRFGNSPESAPLDKWCRSFDIPNLFVVDGSFFPSSGAVNPALTIAAMGLRVGAYLKNQSDSGLI